VRDRRGDLCPVDQVRRDIRQSLGNCTDETLAANAAGQVHPSQVALVARYVRWQRGVVYFLMAVPATAVVIGAAVAGFDNSAHGDPSRALGWGAFGFGSIALLAIVLARGVGRTVTVRQVRGRIDAFGNSTTASPRLAGETIGVDARWVGMPVVVHRVKCGMTEPLYLSGDLEVDRITPVAPPTERGPASSSTPAAARAAEITETPPRQPDVVVMGDDFVAYHRAWLAIAVVSSTFAIWTFLALLHSHSGVVVMAFLWAAISVPGVAVQLMKIAGAKLGRRTRFTVRSSDALLMIDAPHKSTRFDLRDLLAIDRRLANNPANRYVTLRFADKSCCQMPNACGETAIHAIRRIRPDVVVADFQPVAESSGGN
jgi:hypothetical protein